MARKFKRLKVSTRRKRRKKTSLWKKLAIFFAVLFIILIVPGIAGIVWFKKNILDQLPDISKIEDIQLAQTSVITDRNGIVLYKLFEQNRKYVPFEKISPNVINAIVATEDKNFWTNPGIDISGLIRAAIHDIVHLGKAKQ
jgi:membrane carboxypeptidase/penicillin-binding protein